MTIQQKLMLTMDLSFTSCSLPPSGKLKPFLFLGGLTIFSSFAGFAYLKTAGFSLVWQHLAACLLSLLLVDELHQHTLVLEPITLGLHVKVVVQMAIDFLCFTIAFQQSPQHSHASNPHKLLGHTSIRSTLSLTKATVTALTASFCVFTNASTWVDGLGFLDDQTILNQLSDVLAGIGVGNLVDFVRVKPNLPFATFHNTR